MDAKSYCRPHHQAIASVLALFDAKFLTDVGVGFGGGTRIAMELNEFRESVDIDFICPSTESYRAIREVLETDSLGALAKREIVLARDVRVDRYGARTAVVHGDSKIKVEFLAFDGWKIDVVQHVRFPVPVIDSVSCFATKLTAIEDRGLMPPYKDVIDIIAMCLSWGSPPQAAINEAQRHYGPRLMQKVESAVSHFLQLPHEKKQQACQALSVSTDFQARIDSLPDVATTKNILDLLTKAP